MDNVIPIGGKKYKAPENLMERKELHDCIRSLNADGFRRFVEKNIPELVQAGWLEKSNEQIILLMHEIRALTIGYGDDFIKSRNLLRARQFGVSEDSIDRLNVCATCKWFREAPSEEEKPCMHLGSIPQDIRCNGYTAT